VTEEGLNSFKWLISGRSYTSPRKDPIKSPVRIPIKAIKTKVRFMGEGIRGPEIG
jgi:hypothetical protein